MNLGFVIVVFIIGIFVGAFLIGLIAAVGKNNSMSDAYSQGYADGLRDKKVEGKDG